MQLDASFPSLCLNFSASQQWNLMYFPLRREGIEASIFFISTCMLKYSVFHYCSIHSHTIFAFLKLKISFFSTRTFQAQVLLTPSSFHRGSIVNFTFPSYFLNDAPLPIATLLMKCSLLNISGYSKFSFLFDALNFYFWWHMNLQSEQIQYL